MWYPRNEKKNSRDARMAPGRKGRTEFPRTASCASASLQHRRDCPVASKRQERERRSNTPRRRERSRRRSRGCCQVKRSGSENSSILHTKWRHKAMVPGWTRVHGSIIRWRKGRESLGGQRMADIPHLPLAGQNQASSGLSILLRDVMRVTNPELQRNDTKLHAK